MSLIRPRRAARLAALAALACALSACEARAGEVLSARLRDCELLSDGELGPRTLAGLYVPDACYERCLATATCDELRGALCRTSLALLLACDDRCAFRCEDGSLVGPERRCDGSPQCAGGEDEAGCDFELTCRDGRRVAGEMCDGAWDCPDGTDENGCPSQVRTCDDGTVWFYPSDVCNGARSCVDGEDERGCPSYRCADRTSLTHGARSPRCDGYPQCPDGSDEVGCARLEFGRCS